MNLALKIVSHQRDSLGEAAFKIFNHQGGSFGRSNDNSWVLPDETRVVSGQHGTVSYEDGNYYVTDTSTNGIYVNGSPEPVGKGNAWLLRDGDMLALGEYQVQVSLTNSQELNSHHDYNQDASLPAASRVPGDFMGRASQTDISNANQGQSGSEENEYDHPIGSPDYDPLLGSGLNQPKPIHHAANLEVDESDQSPDLSNASSSPLSSAFAPQKIKLDDALVSQNNNPDRDIIPTNWDQTGYSASFTGSRLDPRPGPQAPPGNNGPVNPEPDPFAEPITGQTGSRPDTVGQRHQATRSDLMAAFLQGAGLDPATLPQGMDQSHYMETVGKLFRETVEGLMILLQSRAELKNQFRMSATTIRPTENNPLKFTPHVDDALQKLFSSNNPGFLSPEEAIEEAISDIKNHHISMLVGMHAGIEALLNRFNPNQFSKDQDGGLGKVPLLSAGKKARAWEGFCNYYEQTVVLSGDAFQTLFAEDFCVAYDEQLRMLESERGGHN